MLVRMRQQGAADMSRLKWTADDILAFFHRDFPQVFADGRKFFIEKLEPYVIEVRMHADDKHLRPGGTVSGPTMMELVDLAAYMILLAHHGESARLSVTTNLNISFLRKPAPGDILCSAEMVKHGRSLSVIGARLTSLGNAKLVARAEATYHMGGAEW